MFVASRWAVFSGVALGAGAFLLGTLTIYNITLTTLKRTLVKFRRKMSSYSFPTTCVTKTKRVEHRALQTFFYDHHCKKRNNTYETVTIQKDYCRVDDFILRQSTLYYLQCIALRAIRHIKKSLLCSTNFSNLFFRLVAS